ncbi:MAG: DUF4199 domain-containing protein [Lacibacter sp.]
MEQKITSHFAKGLIIGLVMVAIGMTFQIMGIYDRWIQWLVLSIYLVAIVWSCVSYSKDLDGNITFGGVFGHGFKTASIVALISIAAFVLTTWILPELKDKALEMARIEMEKNPQMNSEMIDKALQWTDQYYFLFGVIGSLFSYALVGAIGSLIGAGLAKKNPQSGMPQSI